MQGVSKFLNEYQSYLNVFLIFIAITLVIIFVLNAAKLASAGENPRKRQEAIHGILVTGICIAVLGSFSLQQMRRFQMMRCKIKLFCLILHQSHRKGMHNISGFSAIKMRQCNIYSN